MVSRELEKECIVVFDEAHNIDNVCIEVRKSCHTIFIAQPGCISSLQIITQHCRVEHHRNKKDQRASGKHCYLNSHIQHTASNLILHHQTCSRSKV